MAKPTIDARALASQELEITARGDELRWLTPNVPPDQLEDDRVQKDVVEIFARAVESGVFPRADLTRAARATIEERRFDAGAERQTWRLRMANVDPSALTVLVNLLRGSTSLAAFEIRTAGSFPSDAPRCGASLPAAPTAPPFKIERIEPMRAGRDRDASIVFLEPLSKATADSLLSALEAWSDVVARGGYPKTAARKPAGGIAALPFQFDAYTVLVEFPEYFESHEDAFNGVVELALAAHRGGKAVSEVVVR